MSQIYQVQLTSSLVRTVHASDEMRHRVEITPILNEESMQDLLREALEEEGWNEEEDGTWTKEGPRGETLIWDVEGAEVRALVEVEKEVGAELAATGFGESDEQARADAERSLRRQEQRVESDIAETRTQLEKNIGSDLEEGEAERRRELNRVIQRVYGESLKRKAEELGTVMSVEESEEGDDYELVIRVSE